MLVDQIKKGDKEAFKELFNDYFPILCNFAERFSLEQALCEDVAQEALLKYWESKENFDNIYKVKGFLYTVTKNMSLNIVKRESRSSELEEGREAIPNSEAEIDNIIIENEVMLLVRKAVSSLPTRMREVIELSMKGARNSDIAEALGIAEGTVHSVKKQAYRKLRTLLRDNFYYMLLL